MLKKKRVLYVFALMLAVCFLGICSKSSPLYPMNDWVDVNCFFTVGRAILDGQVLYLDIYEQKGPWLYFIFAAVTFISENSFIGVYLLEVISFTLFLIMGAKIAMLYLDDKISPYFVMIILAAVIPVSKAFSHGGSVEELSLGLLSYSLYSVLKAIKNGETLSFSSSLLNGLCAATVFWMKFTITGFYVGLASFLIIWYISEKKLKELWKTITAFLLGVFLVTIPVLIYFFATDAIADLFHAYFYNNIFVYTSSSNSGVVGFIKNLGSTILINYWYSGFVLIGFLWILKSFSKRWKEALAIIMSCVTWTFLTYFKGRGSVYYGLIFSVYTIFGLIACIKLLLYKKPALIAKILQLKEKTICMVMTVLLISFVGLSYLISNNTYLIGIQKEDMPQYQFAEKIKQVDDATLLNYGFLDGGFYTAANIVPNCKYFSKLNIGLDEMLEIQDEFVEERKVDFIVTRETRLEDYDVDSSSYIMIDEAELYFEEKVYKYYLYQVK